VIFRARTENMQSMRERLEARNLARNNAQMTNATNATTGAPQGNGSPDLGNIEEMLSRLMSQGQFSGTTPQQQQPMMNVQPNNSQLGAQFLNLLNQPQNSLNQSQQMMQNNNKGKGKGTWVAPPMRGFGQAAQNNTFAEKIDVTPWDAGCARVFRYGCWMTSEHAAMVSMQHSSDPNLLDNTLIIANVLKAETVQRIAVACELSDNVHERLDSLYQGLDENIKRRVQADPRIQFTNWSSMVDKYNEAERNARIAALASEAVPTIGSNPMDVDEDSSSPNDIIAELAAAAVDLYKLDISSAKKFITMLSPKEKADLLLHKKKNQNEDQGVASSSSTGFNSAFGKPTMERNESAGSASSSKQSAGNPVKKANDKPKKGGKKDVE